MIKKLLFIAMIISILIIIPVSAETHTFTYSEGGSGQGSYDNASNLNPSSTSRDASTRFILKLYNDQRSEFCDLMLLKASGLGSDNPVEHYQEGTFSLNMVNQPTQIVGSGEIYYTYEYPYIYLSFIFSDGNELHYSDWPAGLLQVEMVTDLTYYNVNQFNATPTGHLNPSDINNFSLYLGSSSTYTYGCGGWLIHRDYPLWKNVLSWDDPDTNNLSHMTLVRETDLGDFMSNLSIIADEITLFEDLNHNYDIERTFVAAISPTYIQVNSPLGGVYTEYIIGEEEEEGEDEEILQFIQTSFDLNSEVGITSVLNLSYNGNNSYYYYDGSMRTSEDVPHVLPDTEYEYRITSEGYQDLYGILSASSDTYYAGLHDADTVSITELDSMSGRAVDFGYGHVNFYMQLTPTYAEATCLYTVKVTDNNGTALSGGVLGITDSINDSTYIVFGSAGGAFTIEKNIPYTLTVTKDGYNSFSKTVNVSEDFYTEYVTLEETFIAPVPTATPYGYNITTGTYETPKNVLESIEYAIGRIFGIETLSNINIILAGLIILFFALMVGYVVKTGSGLMVGSIVGFVISLALGLIPLWVFFAMILLGLLYFALSRGGGD